MGLDFEENGWKVDFNSCTNVFVKLMIRFSVRKELRLHTYGIAVRASRCFRSW